MDLHFRLRRCTSYLVSIHICLITTNMPASAVATMSTVPNTSSRRPSYTLRVQPPSTCPSPPCMASQLQAPTTCHFQAPRREEQKTQSSAGRRAAGEEVVGEVLEGVVRVGARELAQPIAQRRHHRRVEPRPHLVAVCKAERGVWELRVVRVRDGGVRGVERARHSSRWRVTHQTTQLVDGSGGG